VVAAESVAARVRELLAGYRPPTFDHVPGPDAALFLTAIDHRTGYRRPHLVVSRGTFDGSALLWELGTGFERRGLGTLSAASLADVGEAEVEEIFRIEEETVAGAAERARLWRDLAAGLNERHEGRAAALIEVAGARLGGPDGLLAALARFEAYSDPLAKKSQLFAKVAARRGWLEVSDPESWEVCADNVLMRLALRSGLVEAGDAEQVRAATREAFGAVAGAAGIEPPLLDDMLWELGRRDPDLLGIANGGAGLREPERPAGTLYY
jgi:hypothetical protein